MTITKRLIKLISGFALVGAIAGATPSLASAQSCTAANLTSTAPSSPGSRVTGTLITSCEAGTAKGTVTLYEANTNYSGIQSISSWSYVGSATSYRTWSTGSAWTSKTFDGVGATQTRCGFHKWRASLRLTTASGRVYAADRDWQSFVIC